MAAVNINDVASQLNTASRLVVSTDFFWIYMANGSQVKIPAEFARAYLIAGIKPTINGNGHWEIGGEDLGVVAVGKTPQFRGGTMGIEVSYDNGQTWSQVVSYTEIDPDLEALAAAYTKVTQGEADRVKAENTRNSNETARQNAETTRNNNETARQTAENTRNSKETARQTSENTRNSKETERQTAENTRSSNETARQNAETTRNNQEATRVTQENTRQSNETTRNSNEETRKKQESTRQSQEAARVEAEKKRVTDENGRASAETSRVNAEIKRNEDTKTAISNSQTQTAIAQELNEHPVKMGDNGNWWQWNIRTHAYEDTGIVARGGAMYPTFKHVGNKLYIVDYGSNVSERVVKKGNKLVFRI